MKKVFGFLALALTLAACNKMGEMDYRPAQESGEITITAKLAPKSPITKAVNDQTDHIQVTWAEHEHIAILY